MARGLSRSSIRLVCMAILAPLTLGQACQQSDDAVPGVTGNRPPQAQFNEGLALTADVGETVILDASASWDPDADRLTFGWTQSSGPSVSITDADQATASFTPGESGIYIFVVEVSDGRGGSDEAPLRVSVGDPSTSPSE